MPNSEHSEYPWMDVPHFWLEIPNQNYFLTPKSPAGKEENILEEVYNRVNQNGSETFIQDFLTALHASTRRF
jgi:hypothetical protein